MKEFKTPMMIQYQKIKEEYPDTILLFRMGDFYEMFLDDAKRGAEILNITLTNRSKGQDGHIPMCGVPYHAIDKYIPKLVQRGEKVAICEQLEEASSSKGIVDRGVVRIITPGTIYEDSLLDKGLHNYLSTYKFNSKTNKATIVFIDISTGDFNYKQFDADNISKLIERLAKFEPKEVVLTEKDYNNSEHIKHLVNHKLNTTNFKNYKEESSLKKTLEQIREFFKVQNLSKYNIDENDSELIYCLNLILKYLEYTHREYLNHITEISEIHDDKSFRLDLQTINNLEIFNSSVNEQIYNSSETSFIKVVDKTSTPMGSRKLRADIIKLTTDKNKLLSIHQSLVELQTNTNLRNELEILVKSIGDIPRLCAKINSITATPSDLVKLKDFLIQSILVIKKTIKNQVFETVEYIEKFDSIENILQQIIEVTKQIDRTLIENSPNTLKDKDFIKPGINQQLDDIKQSIEDSKLWLEQLEEREKENTAIPTLKVKENSVFGYFIEISKLHGDKVPAHYIRKQTLVNAERYITDELKKKEEIVNSAKEQIHKIEIDIFIDLKQSVLSNISQMRQISKIIANIDVLISSTNLALQYNLIKPEINEQKHYNLELEEARHIIIESTLDSKPFTPNDTSLTKKHFLHLITGPNMAGKSTYIRQVALIQIMAQAGMFIPAAKAKISLVDGIYTRIGAADSLAQGLSTFMVEMLETAKILNTATENSLVILDEVGRGTSTTDGLAIAKAIVEYLHNDIKCKTLFATHYHELITLEQKLRNFKNYKILITEENKQIKFLHKVVEGYIEKSYGLEVARLAGLPEEVLQRASKLMKNANTNQLKLEI